MQTIKFFALFVVLFFAACKGGDANSNNNSGTASTPAPAAEKVIKKGEIKGAIPADIAAAIGLKFGEKGKFGGFYEYYEKEGKPVLHGKYELKTDETMEDFVARHSKGADDEANFELMWDYVDINFKGQFVDGQPDGKMTFTISSHGAGGEGFILYDAKTKSCTDAQYIGGAESICFEYKGKLPNCKFDEFSSLTKEVACK